MRFLFFTVGIVLLYIKFSFSQSASTLMGARSGGLGYTSSCIKDEWSFFNNIGGLAGVENTSVFCTYDMQPSFKPFNRMATAVALPTKFGVLGTGIFKFGDELYSEQIISLGFANTFGLASLGIKVNYIQYKAEGFGTKGLATLSFGGIAKLTEKMFVGAYITNLNQPNLSAAADEKLPTMLALGVAFQLSQKTYVTTEVQKDLGYPLRWSAGLEYQPFKKFVFRTGYSIHPTNGFFGVGFHSKKFKCDYGYQHSFVIGSRHQASVGYFINKPK